MAFITKAHLNSRFRSTLMWCNVCIRLLCNGLLGNSLLGKSLAMACLLAASTAFAVAPALDTSECAPDGVALGGYDLVSYYTSSVPKLGSATIVIEYDGLQYQFSNLENRDAFAANPNEYLPSYLGWCSTNLSMGRLACPDYTNFKIENGKLLLFERVGFTNGLDVWNSDPGLHKRQAALNLGRFSTLQ